MAIEVIKINDTTWRFEDNERVRFFLLTGEEKALLIDSGMTVENAKDLAEKLTDLPLMLINTHGDRDHVASNHQFDTFYMNPAEEENYYKVQHMTGTYLPVEDRDVIDLGGRPLKIIALPGHTPGSIALLDVNGKMLFSGDPVQDGMIFMFGPQRNMDLYRESLKKLEDMKGQFDEIYPSHGSCPVKPELIGQLYQASGNLASKDYPRWPMEFFGKPVQCVDVKVAKYLID